MTALDEIKQSTDFLSLYTQALSYLHGSGLLRLLREFGQVKYVPAETPNYSAVLASQAEFSRGYNQALDDLIYFREQYLDPLTKASPQLDFGALRRAVLTGDLTEEEADELRKSTTSELGN